MSYNFYNFLVELFDSLSRWAKLKRSKAYDKWFIKYAEKEFSTDVCVDIIHHK